MISKEGKKGSYVYLFKTNRLKKRYVSFKSNCPKHCLKNISFSLACIICTITGKDFLKEIKLKELDRNTSTRAALPRKNVKSSYEKSFKNTPE